MAPSSRWTFAQEADTQLYSAELFIHAMTPTASGDASPAARRSAHFRRAGCRARSSSFRRRHRGRLASELSNVEATGTLIRSFGMHIDRQAAGSLVGHSGNKASAFTMPHFSFHEVTQLTAARQRFAHGVIMPIDMRYR